MIIKKCISCNRTRNHKSKGLCDSCYTRLWQKKNIKKYNDYLKKWRKENLNLLEVYDKKYNCSEKRKEATKRWRKQNLEYFNRYSQKWRKDNAEHYRKWQNKWYKQWTKENPHKIKLISQKRRANLLNIKHIFTKEEWNLKVKLTKGKCPKCNNLVGYKKLTLDHIIPLSSGRKRIYTIKDIQPLCGSCNSSKGNKLIEVTC